MTASDVRDRLTRALRLDLIGSEPDHADVTGHPAWLFPEWFVAQYEERNIEGGEVSGR